MARKRDRQDEATSDDIAVDDRTAALEEAAAARIEGPVGVSGPLDEQATGESVTGEALPRGTTWSQVNEGVGEQLADPEDGEGLEGDPTDADYVAAAKEARHDWLFGDGDGEDEGSSLSPPFGGSPQAGAEGGGGRTSQPGAEGGGGGKASVGGQNVYGQEMIDAGDLPPTNPAAGTAAPSPLTAAADAADAKLGRDSGLSGGDDVDDAPAFGKGMISEYVFASSESGRTTTGVDTTTGNVRSVTNSPTIDVVHDTGVDEVGPYNNTYVFDKTNGTVTTTHIDGSYETKTLGGVPIDSGGPLVDPGPDGEAPIPAEFYRGEIVLDDLRAAAPHRNPDDGAEDPVEGDPAFGAGAGTGTPTGLLAQGRGGLLGNPEGIEVGGGAPSGNPGADSQGAGVINTENDPTAKGPEDNPFDAAEPTIEPFEESGESETESDDDGAESFLSVGPDDIAGRVDVLADDAPDHIAGPA